MPDIRLIATDLDGTLIGPANELPLFDRFRDLVERLREERGTIWAACTGRGMRSFKSFFYPIQAMGLTPDYVITSHAYLYRHTAFGYIPHLWWCLAIQRHIRRNGRECLRLLNDLGRSMRGASHGVRMALREPGRLRLRFDTEDSARAALAVVLKRIQGRADLAAERELCEVEVHTIPYTKGLAVAELARHLGVRRSQVVTIGDGLNDISMLSRAVAGYSGCPGNADTVVMEAVHEAGGHISKESTLSGVLDILQAILDGKIQSELPEKWDDEAHNRGSFERRPRMRNHRRRSRRRSIVVFFSVVAVSVLVMASFDLLPGSELVIEPFDMAIGAAIRLFEWVAGAFR